VREEIRRFGVSPLLHLLLQLQKKVQLQQMEIV